MPREVLPELLALPGVRVLATKRITPRVPRRPGERRRLDLIEVRRPRVYLVIESRRGGYFEQIEEFFTLREARAVWRCVFKAPVISDALRAIIRPELDR